MMDLRRLAILLWALTLSVAARAEKPVTGDSAEFFEKHVRPVLAANCYSCHGEKKEHNGLRLDSRERMLHGGDNGPAIVPGKPGESLLIEAVRHESFEMPPKSRLRPQEIAALERWVKMGAPWPKDQTTAAVQTKSLAERAREHWAFQPVRQPEVPEVRNAAWSNHPVDRFLMAKWEQFDLPPAEEADPRTILRRLTFALTGLPPTVEEIEEFARSHSRTPAPPHSHTSSTRGRGQGSAGEDSYAALVDRLLASPQFGERWARHWMDWVRYAETHGSEGDPPIPQAFEYRDYLIRALNADVPYDQLVREHIAGDLLPQPRMNREQGINESAIGPAQFRFVQHGFQPTDPLDDFCTFTENQIDVVTKAFQGLTVACARCHDHKFDAISQADYYALFGIFAASRPGQRSIDLPERAAQLEPLARLVGKLRQPLAEAWSAGAKSLSAARLDSALASDPAIAEAARRDRFHPLHPWLLTRELAGVKLRDKWEAIGRGIEGEMKLRSSAPPVSSPARWDFTRDVDCAAWQFADSSRKVLPTAAGAVALAMGGDRVVRAVYPRGVYSNLLSDKQGAVLTSPKFRIDCEAISVRMLGSGLSQAKLVVQNYPLSRGGIHGQRFSPSREELGWVTWDVTYWKGDDAYIEIATCDDLTMSPEKKKPNEASQRNVEGRSFFGVAQVAFHAQKDERPADTTFANRCLFPSGAAGPESKEEMVSRYREAAAAAVAAFQGGTMDDRQAAFLNGLVQLHLLPNTMDELPALRNLVEEYRRLEGALPASRRVPGVLESAGCDLPLLTRGDHRRPAEAVPRRYLEALGGTTSYATTQTGRLQLATDLTSRENPLTARVVVNRIWHYLFGRGLVATVDNFGQLGERPSHPELLDYLAARFIEQGCSTKEMIRFLVASRAWRMASVSSEAARRLDPSNAWLSHARTRRLEAEEIRDAIVATAGKLDRAMFGPSVEIGVPPGRPQRRSIYMAVRRNRLSPFLEAFDAPKPFTTVGRRDATNVPAQSLTLLNDPFVIEQARQWAAATIRDRAGATVEQRAALMFAAALGREPDRDERSRCLAFVADLAATHQASGGDALSSEPVWRDYAQSLFNLKEFIYLR